MKIFNEWYNQSLLRFGYGRNYDEFFVETDSNGNLFENSNNLDFAEYRFINLNQCTLINLDDKVKKMLSETSNNIKTLKLNFPFKSIFIETIIMDYIEGILITKLVNNYDKNKIERIHVELRLKHSDGTKGFFQFIWDDESFQKVSKVDDIKYYGDDSISYRNESLNKFNENKHEIITFIYNCLDFLNHQEVEYIRKEHWNNKKRIKRGKPIIPPILEIVLKGKLKKYIYETQEKNEKLWELGHRFWVRGHWVNFTSDRYKNKKGKKTWILPYIKGTGELKNKDYYLGEKERCWANEKIMKEIIQSIFPDKEIINNNRTVLGGLEIDCYVPDLKIGFEYNGEQHYNHVKIFHKTEEDFESQKKRDIEKNKRAKDLGIRLITIRYDEELSEELIRGKLK